MTSPIPADTLITYVKARRADGAAPLDNPSDAVTVSTQLTEQADSLMGHFVTRPGARARPGARSAPARA